MVVPPRPKARARCSSTPKGRTGAPRACSPTSGNADQCRQTSVLILPRSKEVFLLEDYEVLAWRNGAGTWADGTVTVGLSIKTTTAAAVTLQLAS